MVLNNFVCQICAVQFEIRRNVNVDETPISSSHDSRQPGRVRAAAEAESQVMANETFYTAYDGAAISAAELKVLNIVSSFIFSSNHMTPQVLCPKH
jgi:hypothetical protein